MSTDSDLFVDLFEVATRICLAALFAASGITKLWNREGTTSSFVEFGIDQKIAVPGSFVLPAIEVALGISLLTSFAPWGAAFLCALLGIFSVVIYLNLSKKNYPNCGCFGGFTSAPISSRSLLRNGLLMATSAALTIAAVLGSGTTQLWEGIDSLGTPKGLAIAAISILTLVCLGEAMLIAYLLQQHGAMRKLMSDRNSGGIPMPASSLVIGELMTDFELHNLFGDRTYLSELVAASGQTLVAFVGFDCSACEGLFSVLEQRIPAYGDLELPGTIAIVPNLPTVGSIPPKFKYFLADDFDQIARELQIQGTPSALLISPELHIVSQVAIGSPAIVELIDSQVQQSQPHESEVSNLMFSNLDSFVKVSEI